MAITFEISPITPPPHYAGVPISIIAQNVVGGTPPYYYAFYEFNGVGWTLKQDYSESNSFIWRPSTIGHGQFIQVWVKDSLHVGPDPYDAWMAFDPITVVANGSWIRYNENDKRYEISKNVGLTWSPLDLSGDLALLAAIYQNFTGKISFGTSVNPNLIGDNGDICISRVSAPGSGAIYFGNTLGHFIYWSGVTFLTSGPLSVGGGIVERGRSYAIGEWVNVAFSAANYTGSGSMTWTVTSNDIWTHAYRQIGKSMLLNFHVRGTVGGTANQALQIAIPEGKTCAAQATTIIRILNNGVEGLGICQVAAGSQVIQVYLTNFGNWAIGPSSFIIGQIEFEVTT